jgi:hypothetical protein
LDATRKAWTYLTEASAEVMAPQECASVAQPCLDEREPRVEHPRIELEDDHACSSDRLVMSVLEKDSSPEKVSIAQRVVDVDLRPAIRGHGRLEMRFAGCDGQFGNGGFQLGEEQSAVARYRRLDDDGAVEPPSTHHRLVDPASSCMNAA